jgi:hypothetical protein
MVYIFGPDNNLMSIFIFKHFLSLSYGTKNKRLNRIDLYFFAPFSMNGVCKEQGRRFLLLYPHKLGRHSERSEKFLTAAI